MIKVNIEGENEQINEFIKNLKESNFYFSVTSQNENNPSNISLTVSEVPGKIPDEAGFSFRGFIAEWIRDGLYSTLKDFLHLSNNGIMISFENISEFKKINDFLTDNFGGNVDISQMLDRISENNVNNFENSELMVFGCDTDFDNEM
ncbi:hypothetical protein [Clostridium sp. BNL1100]|uniref:hypothetical protein n=1 Tax=Clostridium sp. BNL1100 TaxID=755731 RepID=UPI00024A76BE|nr:hypothetical protein [Clostridium sp. BNL1100]AEY65593.1 hypothetical protein Clo1100_1357 [Clostridium sp. BNL1100]